MQYTENYQFRKPVIGIDVADVKDINFNSDRADTLIHNTQISLAPAYDLNETYDTGDVVMYETLMYKCKADNTTGAWDPSKWERTTAGEEGAGGGGSSVVPNPSGTPTDTLNTIGIDGTIFDIAGSGGGGSGSNYTEVSLYTGTSRVTNMTLSESIKNFDAIEFQTAWLYNSLPYQISEIITSENLSADNYFVIGSNTYRYAELLVVDNTHIDWTGGSDNIMYMKEIKGIKYGSGGGRNSEIIPISAGDGTTSRTFTFDKTPKKITMQGYTSSDSGWYESGYFIWGENFMNLIGAQYTVATGGYAGQAAISYGADGKSFTITAANSFGAFNRADNFSGMMLVDYGGGSGSSEEISDMTWTELISTTGTSTAVAIPQGTKKLVLTAQLGGIVTKVAEESMANIQKLLDVSLETTWNMGGEYADTAGNHTTIAMSVSNGQVVAKSGYNTVTAKVYALS